MSITADQVRRIGLLKFTVSMNQEIIEAADQDLGFDVDISGDLLTIKW